MDFLDKLGIDWKLFTAQLINFAVLLFVLYRFLYKPVLKLLDLRRKKIEENERRSQVLDKELRSVSEVKEKTLQEAEREFQKIVLKATHEAEVQRQEILSKAVREAEEYTLQARAKIKEEERAQLEEVKSASRELIRRGVETMLTRIADKETASMLFQKALNEMKKYEA